MKTLKIDAPNGAIAFREFAGKGPAAVLIHGNSSSSRVFSRQLDGPLGERFRLVAVDLPGHGASDDAKRPERLFAARPRPRRPGGRGRASARRRGFRRLEPRRSCRARNGAGSPERARVHDLRHAAARLPAGYGRGVPAKPGDALHLQRTYRPRAGGRLRPLVFQAGFRRRSALLPGRRHANGRAGAQQSRGQHRPGRGPRRGRGGARSQSPARRAARRRRSSSSTAAISRRSPCRRCGAARCRSSLALGTRRTGRRRRPSTRCSRRSSKRRREGGSPRSLPKLRLKRSFTHVDFEFDRRSRRPISPSMAFRSRWPRFCSPGRTFRYKTIGLTMGKSARSPLGAFESGCSYASSSIAARRVGSYHCVRPIRAR